MAIKLSSRYGRHSVPLDETNLGGLEHAVRNFLADEQVEMAFKHPQYCASTRFQDTQYAPVPAHLKRVFTEKDLKQRTHKEGTYGHWICLLEFLLRLTGKEIIYNEEGWDAYGESIFDLSPSHETLKFLKSGLLMHAGSMARQHQWAGEPCRENMEAQMQETGERVRVLFAQPCALATLKDGWGVRTGIRREMHRFAAAMHIVFQSANTTMPVGKRRRGYAHQHSLQELVSLNARENDRDDAVRRMIEGLNWSLRRLALFMRRQVRVVLENVPQEYEQMTVLMDATAPVRDEEELRFQLQSMDRPIIFGYMNYHNVDYDSSVPLPVVNAPTSAEVQRVLMAGEEGRRAIDAIVAVAVSGHDSDAHRYLEAKRHSASAGSGWMQGQRPAHGKWF